MSYETFLGDWYGADPATLTTLTSPPPPVTPATESEQPAEPTAAPTPRLDTHAAPPPGSAPGQDPSEQPARVGKPGCEYCDAYPELPCAYHR